jgi:hypothetical protein
MASEISFFESLQLWRSKLQSVAWKKVEESVFQQSQLAIEKILIIFSN